MSRNDKAVTPVYSRYACWGLGCAGILILSPDALLLRLTTGDDFAVVVLRALFSALSLAVLIVWLPGLRRGFRKKPVCIYGALFSLGLVCFPLSIKYTHVANTLVIISAAPMLAAIGAYFILGERTRLVTFAAAGVIFAGMVIIFAGNIGSGGFTGDLLAALVAISLASTSITVRRYPHTAIYPGLIVGCLIVAVVFSGFADWREVSGRDVGILAIDGALVMTFSFLLILTAARGLPAAELNLIFLLETLLGPFWVWLFLHEVPPAQTVIAGILIALVLIIHTLLLLKKKPALPAEAGGG